MRVKRRSFAVVVGMTAVSVSLLVTAMFLISLGHASATLLQGTPESGGCDVAPLDINHVQELASYPVPSPTSAGDPDTAQIDENTAHTITGVIVEAISCANANDPLRSLALFTDRYISERFGPDHPDDLGSLEASSRQPVPAATQDELKLIEVSDLQLTSSNRANAIVTTENQTNRYVDLLSFELINGTWKIDTWTALSIDATPAA